MKQLQTSPLSSSSQAALVSPQCSSPSTHALRVPASLHFPKRNENRHPLRASSELAKRGREIRVPPVVTSKRRRVSKSEILLRSKTSLERLFGRHRGQVLRFCFSIPFVLLGICALLSYLFTRVWIRTISWFGLERRVRSLRTQLNHSSTIQEYEATAKELDRLTGCQAWKAEVKSSSYDWRRVMLWSKSLRTYRQAGKIHRLCEVLLTAQHLKFGRVFCEDCYSYTHWGTKKAIEEFYDELFLSLSLVLLHTQTDSFRQSPCVEVLRFAKDFATRWGRTALFFSGGGMIGFHHFGVGKALLLMDLVPSVLVGCSAGSAVAAWLGSRSNQDAEKELDGELFARLFTPFEQSSFWHKVANMIYMGHLCTRESWLACANRIYLDQTLLEAYQRTGRVLNISTCRADEDVKESSGAYILNFKSAPNVTLSSAVLASSAFPLLSAPFALVEKIGNGDTIPSTRFSAVPFRDGCLAADVPTNQINREFGVGFSIVAQVNPHVYPFLGLQSAASAGRPARSRLVRRGQSLLALLGRMEDFFHEVMASILRLGISLDVWPSIRGVASSRLYNQNYKGDVTLLPRRIFWTHRLAATNIASDSDVLWYLNEGMVMTFEKTCLIRARLRLESVVTALRQSIEAIEAESSVTGVKTSSPFWGRNKISSRRPYTAQGGGISLRNVRLPFPHGGRKLTRVATVDISGFDATDSQ